MSGALLLTNLYGSASHLLSTHLAASSQPIPAPVLEAAKKASTGGGSLLTPVAVPLAWILAAVYSIIPDYGVAIIGLSIIWMLLISPLTLKSTRSMLAMQKLQPELKRLQAKHRDDRQAFAQAQMDLFKEHNVSPFGSCLPMLLPLPVFFALFRVIDGLSTTYKYKGPGGVITSYATPKFLDQGTKMYKAIVASHGKLEAFGMNLAQSPLAHHNGFLAAAPYWIALVAMAATSYIQSAMMMSRNQASAQANPQMKMMKYLAPAFAIICIRFPVGVIVYYATSNICRIIQQDAMYRFDPKVKSLVAQEVDEVESLTHAIDERERQRPGYTPPRGARPERNGTGSSDRRPGAGAGGRRGGGWGAGRSGPAEAAPTGRSRFRDLLAAAAEQSEARQAQRNQLRSDGGRTGGAGRTSGRGRPTPDPAGQDTGGAGGPRAGGPGANGTVGTNASRGTGRNGTPGRAGTSGNGNGNGNGTGNGAGASGRPAGSAGRSQPRAGAGQARRRQGGRRRRGR
jgi:YidC/Oxa1 family membrane protein insertase